MCKRGKEPGLPMGEPADVMGSKEMFKKQERERSALALRRTKFRDGG